MAYRSGNTLNSTGSTGTVSAPVPTGFAAGDILVGAVEDDIATVPTNGYLPASFTPLASSPLRTTAVDGAAYVCGTRYESGTPPSSYNYSFAAGGGGDSVIVQACFSGGSGTINASTGVTSGGVSQLQNDVSVPPSGISLSPSVTHDLVFVGATDPAGSAGALIWTPAAGMTLKQSILSTNGFCPMALFVHENESAGSTGTLTANANQSNVLSTECAAFLIALAVTGPPPTIVQQPTSATINDGEYWYGWVLSNNPGTDTYQWQQNAGSGWSNVVGQTTNYFTAGTRLHVADSGIQYRCNVTNSDGTTASSAATITVQTPLAATLGDFDPNMRLLGWW